MLGRHREGFEFSARRVVCLDRVMLGRHREGFEVSAGGVVCLDGLTLGRHREGFEFSARSVVGLDRLVLGPRSKILKFKLQRFLLRRLRIRPAQPFRFRLPVNGVPALPRVLD